MCFSGGSCFIQDVCSCPTALVISRDLVPNVFVGVELFVVRHFIREGRPVRDNKFSLRVLMELAIELKEELIVIFVDMEKSFNQISHAFLEEASVGASNKSTAMIRAL